MMNRRGLGTDDILKGAQSVLEKFCPVVSHLVRNVIENVHFIRNKGMASMMLLVYF